MGITDSESQQIVWAASLSGQLEECGHGDIGVDDLLDVLASVGLRLEDDGGGVATRAYQLLLSRDQGLSKPSI